MSATSKTDTLRQYGRFAVTGAANTAVDLTVLNSLILVSVLFSQTGVSNLLFVGIKAVSFIAAVTNSWFLNRYWVFAKEAEGEKTTSRQKTMFLGVSSFSFLLNVLASSAAFAAMTAIGLWNDSLRATVSALIGTVLTQISNFAGYKLLIFKKRHEPRIPIGYNSGVQGRQAHRGDTA